MTEKTQNSSESDSKYIRRRKAYSILSLIVLVLFIAVGTVVLWKPLTDGFREPEKFREWVDASGVWGKLAFIGIVTLQVIFAVIPGEPIEFAAGYAFGAIEGTILCLIGMAIGTMLIFGFVKKFGMKMVEVFVSREKIASMKYLHDSRNLNMLVFTVFFIPGTPKDILTYFIGLTPMKMGTVLLLTTVARIPSVITSAVAGGALGVDRIWAAVVIYAITGVVSIIGLLVYRKMSIKNNKTD